MRLTRAVARFLLIVALLAGWQAALVHPLEHVDERGHLVHTGDGHDRGDRSSSDPSAKLCDALSALMAFAASGKPQTVLEAECSSHYAFLAERLRRADPPPFLSQGPPALL